MFKLSAVAEIERENIRVQTMEGRMQKTREGKWNGGFAPYGYKLVDGALVINEEEAVAIRTIFDLNVNHNMGASGIARYLDTHGISKVARQNGKSPIFSASLVKRRIQNPVYCGKIAYCRRRTEKVHGTRNDYHLVHHDDYILVDGQHEGIVSEELLDAAVIEAISTIVKNKKCADFMRSKINSKVDVSELEEELDTLNKQLRQQNSRRDGPGGRG